MMIRSPFETKSPYEVLASVRQARLMVAISNATVMVAVPIVAIYALMLASRPSWQILIAMVLVGMFIPLRQVSVHLTRHGRAGLASYILLPSVAVTLGVNTLLIAGLDMVVGPALVVFVVMVGMLLGPKESYGVAGISIVMWLVTQYLLRNELVSPTPLPEPLGPISMMVIMALAFITTAVLSQLATDDLRRALDDATYDLVQANRQLEEASKLKSQFTARTSHELRTPLSAIIVFTDLALRRAYGPLTDKQEDSLRRVLLSAKRLQALIEDILDLSKIEAGELEIVEAKFPVGHLVETGVSTLDNRSREKSLTFSET